jgi:hypothetical protein
MKKTFHQFYLFTRNWCVPIAAGVEVGQHWNLWAGALTWFILTEIFEIHQKLEDLAAGLAPPIFSVEQRFSKQQLADTLTEIQSRQRMYRER